MKLFDPNRPRVNARPEMSGWRGVIVPNLIIFPNEDGTTRISAMIADDKTGRYSARQVSRNITDTDIQRVLSAYRDDPENTLETLFDISLCPIQEPSDKVLLHGLQNERMKGPKKESIETRLQRMKI